jgi:HAD superfamily hydrolase (TIGR01549 family)
MRTTATVVKAIIFDIDGTLIDSVGSHAESWVRAFAHFGVSADLAEVRNQIGKGADRLMPEFLPNDISESCMKEIEQYRAALFKREYLGKVKGFPKVRELFQRIRSNGQKIVLASSCTQAEIGRYKDIADIADLVDCEATSDDADCSKPAPDIFLMALRRIAPITASEAVVVGDSPFDAEAARRAGIAFVGVRCGGFDEQQLRQPGCLALFDDPADLLLRFDSSPLAPDKAARSHEANAARDLSPA